MAISSEMSNQGTTRSLRSSHRNMAFLIEALVVLAFLMVSMAVFVRLFAGAQVEGLSSVRQSQAVLAATNGAEEFSANPADVTDFTTEDGLMVSFDVSDEAHGTGTLYDATITVRDGEDEIYVLHTARYVSAAIGGAS